MADGILNPIEQLEADFDFDVYTKQEVDALLDEKADKSDTYTKTETDALLDDKADADAVYTKTETDTLLSAKADKSTTLAGYGITDAYTKTQTDTLLNGKADADSVYTKTEINTKIPNTVGSATKPTYVNGGVITECTHELNKTVPANAVFTDTTYSAGNGLNLSGTSFSAKAGTNVTVDGNGINVNGNGVVASADSGLISGGTAYTELRPTLDGTWVKNAQTTAINLQKLEGGIEYLYAILSKQYDQLKKYINGNYYDYDTDTDSAYTKTVPNGAMPYASLEQIGGKTLVWNQLCYDGNFTDATVWRGESASYVTVSVANNELTATVIRTPTAFYNLGVRRGSHFTSYVAGHKYLMQMEVYLPYASSSIIGRNPNIIDNESGQLTIAPNVVANTWTQCSGIFTAKQANTIDVYIAPNTFADYQVGDTWKMRNYILVDLTLLYGAGNEPTSVAEFQQMFPAQYYSYNAGTLLSAGVTEVKSVGKNLADYSGGQGYPSDTASSTATKRIYEVGKWVKDIAFSNAYTSGRVAVTIGDNSISINTLTGGYGVGIPFNCDENTAYSFSFIPQNSTLCAVMWYAKDGTFISNKTIANPTSAGYTYTSPANATQGVLLLATNQSNTPCSFTNIQIEKSATATTYSPYKKITYPIPAEVQALEGYGWSAGSVYNYIDYERKVFVQNVGRVDFGTLNWVWRPDFNSFFTLELKSVAKYSASIQTENINFTSEKYLITTVASPDILLNDQLVFGTSGAVWVKTNGTQDVAPTGMFYYALATPIETDISQYLTYDNLIEVEAGGTLTFPNQHGDDYQIPVPSSETYMVDLQASLGG